MKLRRNPSGDRSTILLPLALAWVVAGCGGGTPPPPTSDATAQTSAPAVASKATPVKPGKGRGQPLSPGGDEGVRERRNKKQGEKGESGKP